MNLILLVLSIITFIILLTSLIESVIGLNSINSLSSIDITKEKQSCPLVSIIVTANNEEKAISQTIMMLSQQQYPHVEIICVNDRSNDETGAVLNQFSEKDNRIQVLHINQLPENWLGKNYACYCAAKIAKGDWLLFIDADVLLQPSALLRTIIYASNNKLDHLTVFANYRCEGFFYNIFHLVHKGHGYLLALKPWLAKSKKSRKSINSGVFCLVKSTAYQACGGHQSIALECIDDLALGKAIKQHGFAQDIVNAQDYISITWYDSLLNMCHGLKKNCFAYFNYKLLPVIFGSFAWVALLVWPVFACFVTDGLCQQFNIINTLILFALYIQIAHFFRIHKLYSLFFPIGAVLYLYPMYASAFHFLFNRGIHWRGTFYPAVMLKNKKS